MPLQNPLLLHHFYIIQTLRSEQNGCHYAENISECIILIEKYYKFECNFTDVRSGYQTDN